MMPRWLRIAHRGASGSAPEHTRPAFARALDLGVDMIELDVQLTRDAELIVIHDLELDRTTDGHGAVREHTRAEIQALDAGRWFDAAFTGQSPLTLEEVLALAGDRSALNIEIKAPAADWRTLSARLLPLLKGYDQLSRAIVSCFDVGALAVLREQSPDLRLGLLWHQNDFAEAWRVAGELVLTSFHPHWMLVSAELVEEAHRRGLSLLTWTVNDVATMSELLQHGVDGIISDFPERFDALVVPQRLPA